MESWNELMKLICIQSNWAVHTPKQGCDDRFPGKIAVLPMPTRFLLCKYATIDMSTVDIG